MQKEEGKAKWGSHHFRPRSLSSGSVLSCKLGAGCEAEPRENAACAESNCRTPKIACSPRDSPSRTELACAGGFRHCTGRECALRDRPAAGGDAGRIQCRPRAGGDAGQDHRGDVPAPGGGGRRCAEGGYCCWTWPGCHGAVPGGSAGQAGSGGVGNESEGRTVVAGGRAAKGNCLCRQSLLAGPMRGALVGAVGDHHS